METKLAERDYPIVVLSHQDDDWAGFIAVAPDLPGCVAFGDTRDEAFVDLQAAIPEWIDEAVRLGREVPAPGCMGEQWVRDKAEVTSLIEAQDKLIRAQDEIIKEKDGKLAFAREEIESIKRLMRYHPHDPSVEGAGNVWARNTILDPHVVKALALSKIRRDAH